MRDVVPVYRAIEFIESHLRDDVTVAGMAAAAGYSLCHFIRVFNQIVWYTPYNYLMRRRLSDAARDLLDSDRRVLEVALDYRFNNHETFSRAFKRMFAVQPTIWRGYAAIPRRSLMPALTLAHLEHFNRHGFRRPQQVALPERYLAGLMTPLSGNVQDILCVWESLKLALSKYSLSFDEQLFFGVTLYVDEACQPFYLVGIEIPALDAAPANLVTKTLPAGQYLCLSHVGPADRVSLTWDYLYHIWLPRMGLSPASSLEIEQFGEQMLAGEGENRLCNISIPLSLSTPADDTKHLMW